MGNSNLKAVSGMVSTAAMRAQNSIFTVNGDITRLFLSPLKGPLLLPTAGTNVAQAGTGAWVSSELQIFLQHRPAHALRAIKTVDWLTQASFN